MDQDNLPNFTKLPLWLLSYSISKCKGLFYKISCFLIFLSEISLSFVSVLLNFDYLFRSFSSVWDFAYKEVVRGQFWVFTRHRLLLPSYISLKTLALSCYWSSKILQFQLLFLLWFFACSGDYWLALFLSWSEPASLCFLYTARTRQFLRLLVVFSYSCFWFLWNLST